MVGTHGSWRTDLTEVVAKVVLSVVFSFCLLSYFSVFSVVK